LVAHLFEVRYQKVEHAAVASYSLAKSILRKLNLR